MARSTNWHPPMSLSESEWFEKVPKSVLFAICQQLAMRVADDFTAEAAIKCMADEWAALHQNGIVPQKPARLRTDEQIVASWPAYAQQRYHDSKCA